jgi:hypothetical protein
MPLSDTPIAFWTNAFYVVIGVLVLVRGRAVTEPLPYETSPRVTHRRRTLDAWLVGVSFLLLAVGSGLHHWFNATHQPPAAWWAQLADERGMYLAFGSLAGALWASVAVPWPCRWSPRVCLSLAGTFAGVGLAILAPQPWVDSMWTMPAWALLCVAGVGLKRVELEDGRHRSGWPRAAAFFVGLLGIAMLRELPESNFWPRDGLFGYDELHGVWHGVTSYLMWKLWLSPETRA